MFLYFFKLIHRVLLYFQYFNKFSKFLLINTPFTKQIKELLILGLLFKVICE
jgi:hypothetical protein